MVLNLIIMSFSPVTDPCDPDECQPNGVCVATINEHDSSFYCRCKKKFIGKLCKSKRTFSSFAFLATVHTFFI